MVPIFRILILRAFPVDVVIDNILTIGIALSEPALRFVWTNEPPGKNEVVRGGLEPPTHGFSEWLGIAQEIAVSLGFIVLINEKTVYSNVAN